MKKDVIFSMRMQGKIRKALNEAAKKDHRSVASLLDKILMDYLTAKGFLKEPEFEKERRRFPRKKINTPAKLTGLENEPYPCAVHNISMGGVLVAYRKGTEITFISMGGLPHFGLYLEHPQIDEKLYFDCEACRMHDVGNEIQVGARFSNPNGSYLQKLGSYLM